MPVADRGHHPHPQRLLRRRREFPHVHPKFFSHTWTKIQA
jgi:hypothetical protein